jgi:pantoate--beta-alanine ligase
MQIFTQIDPLRAYWSQQKTTGKSFGFVPTMGALHEGHLSLIRSSEAECDITICSIFVNPTQFNNPTDLAKYPRPIENDIALLRSNGCDVLFCPPEEEIYQDNPQIHFDVGTLGNSLEGFYRPGHFNGVALIVAKLFNIVRPDRAYFGQKDYQQFLIVNRLVRDLNFNVLLRCIPIQREPDGLAMSSRNSRLSDDQRKKAIAFFHCLKMAQSKLKTGTAFHQIREEARQYCRSHSVKLEYFEMADATSLAIQENPSPNTILLIAGYVGEVRLIDNVMINE